MERRGGIKAWFIDPYKQIKIGLVFLTLNLIFAALFAGIAGYYFIEVYSAMAKYFSFTTIEAGQVLAKFQVPIILCLVMVGLFVLISILISVRYTYTIYGPMVSIQNFIDGLLDQNIVPPIELRKGDQLSNIATRLNKLAKLIEVNQFKKEEIDEITRFSKDLADGLMPESLNFPSDSKLAILAANLNQTIPLKNRPAVGDREPKS